MDWNSILTTLVYPLAFIFISTLITVVVVPWLKKQATKTNNEMLKQGAGMAVAFAEELAHNLKKKGETISSDEKQNVAATKLTEFAKKNKVPVSDEEVSLLIKSVLGEKR